MPGASEDTHVNMGLRWSDRMLDVLRRRAGVIREEHM
jgi:hypothetical protein